MLRRRISPHKGAKAGPGRSQLLIQAFQASCNGSSSNPGNSPQRAGTQRLLPCVSDAGKAPPSPGRSLATCPGIDEGGKLDEGNDAGGGGLAQEASSAAMAIIEPGRMDRTDTTLRKNFMTLLLLEALGALLLLVFIVWWTMFSGRKKGELSGGFGAPANPPGADKKKKEKR